MRAVAETQGKPNVTVTLSWDEACALRQLLGQVEIGANELRLGTHLSNVVGEYDSNSRPCSVGDRSNR